MVRRAATQSEVVSRIHGQLAGDIAGGRFIGRLPGERFLARHFRVTLVEIRAALARLEADRLIQRQPRRGSRILARPGRRLGQLSGLFRVWLLTTLLSKQSVFSNRILMGLIRSAAYYGLTAERADLTLDGAAVSQSQPLSAADSHRTAWVILHSEIPPSLAAQWKQRRQPFVFLDTVPADLAGDVNFVGFAAADAVRMATCHLLEHGHRRIALVQRSPSGPIACDRDAGFRWALQEWGLDPRQTPRVYLDDDGGSSDIITAIEGVLHSDACPTALVAAGQNIAADARDVCLAAGVRIPDDMSIIGVGASYPPLDEDPTLTVVDQGSPDRLAELAIQLILRENAIEDPVQILLLPRLVARSSVASPRSASQGSGK
ncbi:MAG: substrate-binding domain-containing protein [Phycisphaerae bacterium]|nr:substrate-binding domain-containing protein [Phycisphaerae bacterium]